MSFNVTGVTTISLAVLFPNAGDDRLDVSADEKRQHPPLGARLSYAFDVSQGGGRRPVERGQDATIARLQFVERLLEDESSGVDDADAIGNLLDLGQAMRREEDGRRRRFAGGPHERLEHALVDDGIEPLGRLVEQQKVGATGERKDNRKRGARALRQARDVLALGNLEGVKGAALDLGAPVREERPRDRQDLIDRHSGPGAAVLADMGGAPPNVDRGTFVAEREAQNLGPRRQTGAPCPSAS